MTMSLIFLVRSFLALSVERSIRKSPESLAHTRYWFLYSCSLPATTGGIHPSFSLYDSGLRILSVSFKFSLLGTLNNP